MTYTQNLIGVDTPVAIPKKKEEVQFVEKQYVPSAVDKVENRDLSPAEKIKAKLLEFGIPVEMLESYSNSSVTMYTMRPSRGVRMKSIEAHSKDIALALEARSIRVQAPIMGTNKVGVEVPNKNRSAVNYEPNMMAQGTMELPIGIDVYGNSVTKDLRDMPHLLVAGSTGSGKSVMLNVILRSLIDQMSPEDMKLVLIDPKRVELSGFKDAPHLMSKVIHEYPQAVKALKWLVDEMEDRYTILESAGVRNIADYANSGAMPYIVCVIDEFADLMLTNENALKSKKAPAYSAKNKPELFSLCQARGIEVTGEESKGTLVAMLEMQDSEDIMNAVDADVEQLIVRLAQMARAVGIHLVIATQRPSVDVITGLIKANMPTRIAFSVNTKIESNIILDRQGAEELVGKGDLLFLDPAVKELQRLQGLFA
jgi:S-DNA-T family DNA segregation ATPase FtsK/SpoIIIE